LSKGPIILSLSKDLRLSKGLLARHQGFDRLSPPLRQAQGERSSGFS